MKRPRDKNLLGYEIKIIPDRESGYFAVRFPDFPGIVTGGYSLEQGIRNAQEALELTVDVMKKRNMLRKGHWGRTFRIQLSLWA